MSAPLSEQRLAEIRARVEAATEGPWCTDDWEIYQGAEYMPGLSTWIGETCRGNTTHEQDRADAAFIAAARSDVPALLAEVAQLRAAARSAAVLFRSVARRAVARQWPNPSTLEQAAADLDRLAGGERS